MTGKHVFWYFVAFFGIIAAVNAIMMTFAIRTHSGVVTDHPYEKGLAYNKVIHAEENQEKLGWKGEIEYKDGVLYFTLRDADGGMLIPEKITATMTRPIQYGMDFSADLQATGTPIAFPMVGLWEIRVDAVYHGKTYQQSKRMVIP